MDNLNLQLDQISTASKQAPPLVKKDTPPQYNWSALWQCCAPLPSCAAAGSGRSRSCSAERSRSGSEEGAEPGSEVEEEAGEEQTCTSRRLWADWCRRRLACDASWDWERRRSSARSPDSGGSSRWTTERKETICSLERHKKYQWTFQTVPESKFRFSSPTWQRVAAAGQPERPWLHLSLSLSWDVGKKTHKSNNITIVRHLAK